MPVPDFGEEAADGSEAAQGLRALAGEDILHVADVAAELVPPVADAGRDALEESVLERGRLVQLHGEEAQFEVG